MLYITNSNNNNNAIDHIVFIYDERLTRHFISITSLHLNEWRNCQNCWCKPYLLTAEKSEGVTDFSAI